VQESSIIIDILKSQMRRCINCLRASKVKRQDPVRVGSELDVDSRAIKPGKHSKVTFNASVMSSS
jgi:hypothetical protein